MRSHARKRTYGTEFFHGTKLQCRTPRIQIRLHFCSKRLFRLFGSDAHRNCQHHDVDNENQNRHKDAKSHTGIFKQQISQTVGLGIRKI